MDYVMALYVNDVFGEDATFTGLLLSGLSLSSILFAFALGMPTYPTMPLSQKLANICTLRTFHKKMNIIVLVLFKN